MLWFEIVLALQRKAGLQTAYQNPQKQRNSRFSSQKLRHKRPTLSPGVE